MNNEKTFGLKVNFYFLFAIAIIPKTGNPTYIPRFNAMTDNPSPKTSDSVSAFP
ncbi:MAG: hypothetical protein CM1200mP11_0260 [Nitrosopumilaceae archaeon]|nr:MAG: hypothetical protein CM1200mP11_0260 [Nitrosopumilaceae archaeon]